MTESEEEMIEGKTKDTEDYFRNEKTWMAYVFPVIAWPRNNRSYYMGTGAFPVGTGAFPVGTGAFPVGTGAFPVGTGKAPECGIGETG